jgi:hypothetical protein
MFSSVGEFLVGEDVAEVLGSAVSMVSLRIGMGWP